MVLMSEEEYNNLMENLYIMSNKDYYNELLKSKKEAEMQAQDKKVIKKNKWNYKRYSEKRKWSYNNSLC